MATKAKATPKAKKPVKPPPPKGDRAGVKPLLNAYRIELDRIIPDPDQPRTEFDGESIERLADSFVMRGQLLPIRVYWSAEADRYVIVDGERRYRAALRTNIKALECVIEAGPRRPDRSEVLQDQLAANVQREDLKPMEQARAFRRLMEARGWNQAELARRAQLSEGAVSRALALLTLPERVQGAIESGEISPAAGYEVSKLADPAEQVAVAGKIVDGRLSRSEAASEVKARREQTHPSPANGSPEIPGPISSETAGKSRPPRSSPDAPYDPERRALGHWSGVTILAEADRGALELGDLVTALRKALVLAEREYEGDARAARKAGP